MGYAVIWVVATADWMAPVGLVVGAMLGFIGTVQGAMATGRWNARGAQEPTIAADKERFAAWQVKKRAVYSDLLRAGRAWAEDSSSSELRASYLDLQMQALLLANQDGVKAIRSLPTDPGSSVRPEQWDILIRALHNDAEQPSHHY
jgi:hypothetical protein